MLHNIEDKDGRGECYMTSTWSIIVRHGMSEGPGLALVGEGGRATGCHYSLSGYHVITLGKHARHWFGRGSDQVQKTTLSRL